MFSFVCSYLLFEAITIVRCENAICKPEIILKCTWLTSWPWHLLSSISMLPFFISNITYYVLYTLDHFTQKLIFSAPLAFRISIFSIWGIFLTCSTRWRSCWQFLKGKYTIYVSMKKKYGKFNISYMFVVFASFSKRYLISKLFSISWILCLLTPESVLVCPTTLSRDVRSIAMIYSKNLEYNEKLALYFVYSV